MDERRPGTKKKMRDLYTFVMAAHRRLGGLEHLTEWAREHPTEFYTKVWIKLLPIQIKADVNHHESPHELSDAELERIARGGGSGVAVSAPEGSGKPH